MSYSDPDLNLLKNEFNYKFFSTKMKMNRIKKSQEALFTII